IKKTTHQLSAPLSLLYFALALHCR
ncbi:unnamed protein product, partial [Chondrus crispus]